MPEQSDTRPYTIPGDYAPQVRQAIEDLYPDSRLKLERVPGVSGLCTLLATPGQAGAIFEKAGLLAQPTSTEGQPPAGAPDDLEAQLSVAERAAATGGDGSVERRRLNSGEPVTRRRLYLGDEKPPVKRRRL